MINLLNKKFHRLLVLEKTNLRTHGNIVWKCLCACGNICYIKSQNLLTGNTKSCGCLNKDNARNKGRGRINKLSSFNNLYYRYKQGAIRRKLEFNICKDDFELLTSNKCYYCGLLPSTIRKTNVYSIPYTYNGIDRVDNSIGYRLDNVVSCCRDCNAKKNSVTVNIARKMLEFLDKKELYDKEKCRT